MSESKLEDIYTKVKVKCPYCRQMTALEPGMGPKYCICSRCDESFWVGIVYLCNNDYAKIQKIINYLPKVTDAIDRGDFD